MVEVGGGVRSYTLGGRPVLDGYGEEAMATAARGQPLLPWPNRVRDGRYCWDGVEHRLPLTEPATNNALHGLVRWTNWTATHKTSASVTMQHVLRPQPGYPFALELTITYSLGSEGLTVTTRARNVGSGSAPYAGGQHPYLATPRQVDDCHLHLAAASYLPTDERGLPVGRLPTAGGPYDFRRPRRIGDVGLDNAYTDLERDSEDKSWVELTTTSGDAIRLWVDSAYPYIQLFTADSVPEPQRRRRSLGVEPMTAPPNALQDGVDVTRLDPGETVTSSWGVSASW